MSSVSLIQRVEVDSGAVSIFVVILVELTNTVFVNSTNITTNIETAVLSNILIVILRAKSVSILAELAKNEERFNFDVDIPIWCSHYRLMNKNWFVVRGAVFLGTMIFR